jgi:hypothetical protein
MSTTEEMLPDRATTPKQGAELRKVLRDLMERQKLPDLVHTSLPH